MHQPEQLQASAREAAAMLKAMSNPHRLLILCLLCDTPGASAGELARATGLSPSATSQHLARMRAGALIDCQRNARCIHYFIKSKAINQLIATLKKIYCP